MGDQADNTLLSFELTPEQEKDYEQNYFIVKRNFIFERAKFNSRKQQVGEPMDNSLRIYTISHDTVISEH